MSESQSALDQLNGRISSLSMGKPGETKSRSDSTSSSISSNSVESCRIRPKSTKSNFLNRSEAEFTAVANQEKYDWYLKAVLK